MSNCHWFAKGIAQIKSAEMNTDGLLDDEVSCAMEEAWKKLNDGIDRDDMVKSDNITVTKVDE